MPPPPRLMRSGTTHDNHGLRPVIDCLDDAQIGVRRRRCRRWLRAPFDRMSSTKFANSSAKESIRQRIFPDRGFRRAHLRQHAIEGKALDAVAAAEAVDVELAVPAHRSRTRTVFFHSVQLTRAATPSVALGRAQRRKPLSSTCMSQKVARHGAVRPATKSPRNQRDKSIRCAP